MEKTATPGCIDILIRPNPEPFGSGFCWSWASVHRRSRQIRAAATRFKSCGSTNPRYDRKATAEGPRQASPSRMATSIGLAYQICAWTRLGSPSIRRLALFRSPSALAQNSAYASLPSTATPSRRCSLPCMNHGCDMRTETGSTADDQTASPLGPITATYSNVDA